EALPAGIRDTVEVPARREARDDVGPARRHLVEEQLPGPRPHELSAALRPRLAAEARARRAARARGHALSRAAVRGAVQYCQAAEPPLRAASRGGRPVSTKAFMRMRSSSIRRFGSVPKARAIVWPIAPTTGL